METKIDWKNIVVVNDKYLNTPKKKYLVALPCFPKSKGFCHRTILVSAIDEIDAVSVAMRLKPKEHIGDIKEVNY
jgi:hypothetical protein